MTVSCWSAQMTHGKKGSHRKHHSMAPGLLCPEAGNRLEALGLDDVDELLRFRTGVGPFVGEGAVVALDLAGGLGPVGAGPLVGDAQFGAGGQFRDR
jgi:hypothetical protein